MNFLDDLNPAQREAAEIRSGPLLVLAGAGSGKTRVLTYRIAHLIKEASVLPWKILAVTFTNKAAGEMRQRVVDLVGDESRDIWLGTFHAICAKILRFDGARLGVDSRFTIYDEEDRRALVRTVLKNLDINPDDLTPRSVVGQISRAKNAMIDATRFGQEAGSSYQKRQLAEVYAAYQQALAQNNAMDFDDLLVELVRRLQDNNEVLEDYQTRFQHVLIDEYQDTNRPQYLLTRLLAKQHRNICCVGDDDQSIYQFRGADIRNILDFERDYPDAKTVRLEQNYRSTGRILAAANAVIQNNQRRKGKNLWTEGAEGDPIELSECADDRGEARQITETISGHFGVHTAKDMAVLYRTNAQSRALEQELQGAGIKYEIVGGLRFYERREIKDLLAYLRILINPADDVSLRRIVNVPKRGIGDTTLGTLAEYGRQHRLPLTDSLNHLAEITALNSRSRKQLGLFNTMIKSLRERLDELNLPSLGMEVFEQSGYREMLRTEGTPEAEVREQNVDQLIADMAEFSQEEENPTLEEFLEAKSLMSPTDELSYEDEAITLMTLHSAKGLEFPIVFICGLEEDLFPTARALEEARTNPESLEEERRLFYVGITRARERLYLSHAERRFAFGAFRESAPSRFVDEIPTDLLHKNRSRHQSYSAPRRPRRILPPPPEKQPAKQGVHYEWDESATPSYDYAEAGDDFLSVGNWVLHPTWGRGRIESSEGVGADLKLSIRFGNNRIKKVAVAYAQLEPA